MAGKNAQPEVKQAIKRFEKERSPDDILLYWLLGEGTPAFKMEKEDADYKAEPQEGQRCGNCEFAYSKLYREKSIRGKYPAFGPRYICSQVRGPIKKDHWCRFWKLGSLLK